MEVGTKLNLWKKPDILEFIRIIKANKKIKVAELCEIFNRTDTEIRTRFRVMGVKKVQGNWEFVTKSSRRTNTLINRIKN